MTRFKDKERINIYLPKWMVNSLRRIEDKTQSQYIEEVLDKYSDLKKPGGKKK